MLPSPVGGPTDSRCSSLGPRLLKKNWVDKGKLVSRPSGVSTAVGDPILVGGDWKILGLELGQWKPLKILEYKNLVGGDWNMTF